ncbi:uncharacterized protein LOC133990750 [Scomber scombrus]|uniref:uncharacterized protein LOC133990750 n=1 Tax=Scomber scombrus TaxID=13677 RepID=UPI002DDC87EF|nr:uncharacterized protein LOC133990750 [Scomber scombrus]
MVPHLYLGVISLSVFATTVANAGISLCKKITWKIGADLVPNAARLFLGNFMASRFNVLPTGEREVKFNYQFADCKFQGLINLKRRFLINQNKLIYRPKSKPAAFMYLIECVYKRNEEGWVPAFLNPGSGVFERLRWLVFRKALLNEQLTAVATTNVIPLGSFIPIWAAVDHLFHQPLLLLMEECVAATTAELQPSSMVYPIINNKCWELLDDPSQSGLCSYCDSTCT